MGSTDKLLHTIKDVADMLSISERDVLDEIKGGRLASVELGGKKLVAASDLSDFLQSLKNRKEKKMITKADWKALELTLKNGTNFTHTWPHDGDDDSAENDSHFVDVKSGTARFEGALHKIVIGFAEWESAGANRRRAVVFVDGRAMVVFTGADDFRQSRLMASVIKIDGHQIKDRAELPSDYDDLRVEPFRGYVTGPRASKGLAVVCADDDYRTMVAHGLLRALEELVAQK